MSILMENDTMGGVSDSGNLGSSPWANININDVLQEETTKASGSFSPLPAGSYTLQLLSAEPGKFTEGSINISTAVTDEGEFTGRRVFIDLPNPVTQTWAPSVLQRLIYAMGATMEAYADPIEVLNRLSQNGHSRFTADVYVKEYNKKDGTKGSKNAVNYRSIRPSA